MRPVATFMSFALVAFPALAARVDVSPPPSPYADTEAVTNVVIQTGRTDVREVKIRLQLEGTPTNDLEIAFGCDANTNGVLDVSEVETVCGWRAGRYFVENVRAWERIETEAATSALCGVIDIQLQNDRHFVPRSFAATCGGAPFRLKGGDTLLMPMCDLHFRRYNVYWMLGK